MHSSIYLHISLEICYKKENITKKNRKKLFVTKHTTAINIENTKNNIKSKNSKTINRILLVFSLILTIKEYLSYWSYSFL